MENRLLLTLNEAASILTVSRATINNLARTGAILRVKIGKSARIPMHSLESYVASLEAAVNEGR